MQFKQKESSMALYEINKSKRDRVREEERNKAIIKQAENKQHNFYNKSKLVNNYCKYK